MCVLSVRRFTLRLELLPRTPSLTLSVFAERIGLFCWSILTRVWRERKVNFRCRFEDSVDYESFGKDRPCTLTISFGPAKDNAREIRAKWRSRLSRLPLSFCSRRQRRPPKLGGRNDAIGTRSIELRVDKGLFNSVRSACHLHPSDTALDWEKYC